MSGKVPLGTEKRRDRWVKTYFCARILMVNNGGKDLGAAY